MRKIIPFLFIAISSWADLKTAKAYFLKWQFKKAEELYLEELKKTNNPEILFNLCISYQKQGRPLAFKHLKTDYPNLQNGLFFYYKGDYPQAFNSFKKDKTPYSYIGMGICKKAQGDFKMAEELFSKAKGIPLGYINLANLYLMLEKETKYLSTIKEGIKNTRDCEILFNFARFLNEKKMFEEALRILKDIQEKEPENILIKEQMVKSLISLGKEEEEIYSIIKTKDKERIYLEGCFCAFSSLYLRALRQFSSCLNDIPLACLRALWISKELGLKGRAEEFYKEISTLFPQDAICDVYLAEMWTKKGSYLMAFNYAKNALKKEPTLEIAHFSLGNIYYLKNDFIKAILSYKNGINLSSSLKHFSHFFQEAFTLRFLPIFLAGYALLWIITIITLYFIHVVGVFLIKDYPSLKRYAVKKRYFLYFYPFVTIIFIGSLIFGEKTIKYIPIELLKETFISLITFIPCGTTFTLLMALVLTRLIKWPKLKIYLSFILLDISLDIAIIVLVSSLVPFFADHPQIFSIVSVIAIVLFRRVRFFIICFILLVFHIFFSLYLLSGYKKVKNDNLKEGEKIFSNCLVSIWFIKWLEPTYSDMASSCILGKSFILLKKGEYSKIEELWHPLIRSLNDWWPLNIRAKFLYDWSMCLSLILQGKRSLAMERLKTIRETPEYKNRYGISFLFELISQKIEREEKGKERYLSFIISYLRSFFSEGGGHLLKKGG